MGVRLPPSPQNFNYNLIKNYFSLISISLNTPSTAITSEGSTEDVVSQDVNDGSVESINIDQVKYGIINDPDGYTNVREEGSAGSIYSSKILFQIYENQQFIIQNTDGDWWLIEFEGEQGYIHKSRVEIIN